LVQDGVPGLAVPMHRDRWWQRLAKGAAGMEPSRKALGVAWLASDDAAWQRISLHVANSGRRDSNPQQPAWRDTRWGFPTGCKATCFQRLTTICRSREASRSLSEQPRQRVPDQEGRARLRLNAPTNRRNQRPRALDERLLPPRSFLLPRRLPSRRPPGSETLGSCLGLGTGIRASTVRRYSRRRRRRPAALSGIRLARSCRSPMSRERSNRRTSLVSQSSISLYWPCRTAECGPRPRFW